jgi:hypothetical protein
LDSQGRTTPGGAPAAAGGREIADISALGRLQESLAKARQELNSLRSAFGSGDITLASAAFAEASTQAARLGIVLEKSASLIARDYKVELNQTAESLRQQGILLDNTAIQQRVYANELQQANLQLIDQGNRLKDVNLQSSIFENEVIAIEQALLDMSNRLQNSALQNALFRNEIAQANAQLDQQSQRLVKSRLQSELYATEIRRANLALDDQKYRLQDSTLQQAIYAQEIRASELAILDFTQRSNNAALQTAIYAEELARAEANTANLGQRIQNTALFERQLANELRASVVALDERRLRLRQTYQNQELFKIGVENTRLALQEEQQQLGFLNAAFAAGTISVNEYADGLGRVNQELISSEQLLISTNVASARDVALTQKKKTALDRLIANYKEVGGTGTDAFRKTAEALGANATQIDLVVAQYGSFADQIVERNRAIKDSIFDASNTFVTEFTNAFIQGKNVLDSFKNFFTNVLNSIAAEIIKQQIAKPIASLLGTFISSFLPGLASGGMAEANRPYIVGERGPELFVPGRTGTVVPNDQLNRQPMAGMGDAGPLTVNFTIQAIDTQTGVEFLVQNKPVITSMISDAYNRRGRRGPLD